MPAPEHMGGGPQSDLDVRGGVLPALPRLRGEADQPVADVHRLARPLDVAEPDEEVGVLETGSNVEIRVHGTHDLDIAHQYGTRVDEDVGAPFQGSVVSRASRSGEDRPAHR